MNYVISASKDKTLFTPGPTMTSHSTKLALLRDLGSRDIEFINLIKKLKVRLLDIGNCSSDNYEIVFMQGSGTFGLESCVTSTVPKDGKLLVITNGAYGNRFISIANKIGIPVEVLDYPEYAQPKVDDIDRTLSEDTSITNVSLVHCETATGIMNQLEEIADVVKRHNRIFIVDAVTTLGAVTMNIEEMGIDYLIGSPDKCLESTGGFSFIYAKKETLEKSKDYSRSLSLNLYDQWQGFENNGQFRFTPPTHSIIALDQALDELEEEGGIEARAARYKKNHKLLNTGMNKLGFQQYLFPNVRGYTITSFLDPENSNFKFEEFYRMLNEKGQVIYWGKLSSWKGFRVSTIGRINHIDINYLLMAIQQTLDELNVKLIRR